MNPYLREGRLKDVIAAIQFLSVYDDYKRAVEDWDEKLSARPASAEESPSACLSWREIFDEHPEFFRTNDKGLVSLVWRRALKKTVDGGRPPLDSDSVNNLIDAAVRLHAAAVEEARHRDARDDVARAEKRWQQDQEQQQERWNTELSESRRRWKQQIRVSVLTAALAFSSAILAAWIKFGSPPPATSVSKQVQSTVREGD